MWEHPGVFVEHRVTRALPLPVTPGQQILNPLISVQRRWPSCLTDVAHTTSVEGADLRSKPGASPARSSRGTRGQWGTARGCGTSPRGLGTTGKGHQACVGSQMQPPAGQGCSSFQPPVSMAGDQQSGTGRPRAISPAAQRGSSLGALGGLLLQGSPTGRRT